MKINALDTNGNIKEYDTVLTYYSEEYNKHYIVYTDNTYDKDDELIIYISAYNPDDIEVLVKEIEDKEEYNYIKTEINKLLLTLKNENDKLN